MGLSWPRRPLPDGRGEVWRWHLAAIAEIWKALQEKNVYAPIHNQFLAYGMRAEFDIPVDVENTPKIRFMVNRRS